MKRFSCMFGLLLFAASGVWAQHHGVAGGHQSGGSVSGGYRGGGFVSGGYRGGVFHGGSVVSPDRLRTGFGSVVFPGGDYAGTRLRGYSTGVWAPSYYYGGFGYYPYSYGYAPFFGGAPLGGDYYSAPSSQPNVIIVGGQAPVEPSAPVVVNQYVPAPVPQPVIQEIPTPPEPPPASDTSSGSSDIYLIAMKSGLIHAALAYWVEGDQLHYITRDRQHKQIALSSVDRSFSAQLNRERRVKFQLPPG